MKALALLGAVLVAGCATTKVTESSQAPSAERRAIEKVLVVALVRDHSSRLDLEDRLADELRDRGTHALPSNTFFEDALTMSDEALRRIVTTNGFDSVLVADLSSSPAAATRLNPSYDEFVAGMGPLVFQPRYVELRNEALVESRLFDVERGGRELWSATTSTVNPGAVEGAIPTIAAAIVRRLDQDLEL